MPRLKKQKEVSEHFSIRWKPSQRAAVEANAKKFTGGNISEWLIYAGMNMVPPKEDLSQDDSDERDDERERTQ